jgi:hypothetical protein
MLMNYVTATREVVFETDDISMLIKEPGYLEIWLKNGKSLIIEGWDAPSAIYDDLKQKVKRTYAY